MWPFAKTEKRQVDYSDAVTNQILANATGGAASSRNTGALETVSGLVGRAFASAEVSGPAPYVEALTPATMGLIGRELIRRGEALFLIELDEDDRLRLFPISNYTVNGGYNPRTLDVRL